VDLENALMGHPSVKEAAVIGVAQPEMGRSAPWLWSVLNEGKQAQPAELREFLAGEIREVAVARRLCVHEEIPRTSVGNSAESPCASSFADWKWES